MGCVLPAGQGQAPARQAALGGGLPLSTGATTVNKMCGSGMKAAMFAHDMLATGANEIMVAGGMESMTNAPYLLPKARLGYRMGHQQVIDHMFFDGLGRRLCKGRERRGKLMGVFAEDCAAKYSFTREEQDKFAVASLERAQTASARGAPSRGKTTRSPSRPARPSASWSRTSPRSRPTSRRSRR
jgi:acetyl-CoA C-acetyltransferase